MNDEFLSVKELAARLGVHPNFVYSRTSGQRASNIPFVRLGRLIRFRWSDVLRWIENGQPR